MQNAISYKIQLGETLNPLKDYSGIPSINDEGTLQNLIGKVDKVTGFAKTDKADGDLSRYYRNILPITRQSQISGEVPRKAYASITYSDKKQLDLLLILLQILIVIIVQWKYVCQLSLRRNLIKPSKWMQI